MEPPRRIVRVSDPGPASAGQAEPPRRRRPVGRWVVGAAGLVVVAVLWSSMLGSAPAVDLQAEEHPAAHVGATTGPAGEVHLQVPLRLANHGSQAVRVQAASVDRSPLAAAAGTDLRLPVGSAAQVLLEQDVRCRPDGPPPLPPLPAALRLRVLAADGSSHSTVVQLSDEPSASVGRELLQLCGYVPAQEAVRVTPAPGVVTPDGVSVPLRLTNVTAERARVLSVSPALPGVSVQLLQDGPVPVPIELPLELPVDAVSRPRLEEVPLAGTGVQLVLHSDAGGCAVLRAAGPEGALVLLRVDHGPGTPSVDVHPPDTALALPLLAARCR